MTYVIYYFKVIWGTRKTKKIMNAVFLAVGEAREIIL